MSVEKIGQYEILRALGESRFGAAYCARDADTGQDVVLKIIPRRVIQDASLYARLSRQTELLALLDNPAIAPLIEVREDEENLLISMRLFRSGSLRDRLKNGPLEVEGTTAVITRLAAALDAAHNTGLVHQDIHPGNVLMDDDGQAWLADFGSHLLAGACLQPGEYTLLGPPVSQSPEQASALNQIDGRSDIYALGALLYQMLTGQPAWQSATALGSAALRLADPTPTLPPGSSLPAWLNTVLARAMSADPAQRYARAGEMAADLAAGLDGKLQAPADALLRIRAVATREIATAMPRSTHAGSLTRIPSPLGGGGEDNRTPRQAPHRRSWMGRVFALMLLLAGGLAAAIYFGLIPLNLPLPGQAILTTSIAAVGSALTPGPSPEGGGEGNVAAAATAASPTRGVLSVAEALATTRAGQITPEASSSVPTASALTPGPSPEGGGETAAPTAAAPASPAVAIPANPLTYTFQYNDTFFKIASQFNLDLTLLIAINDLKCDSRVLPGQDMLIPAASIHTFPTAFRSFSLQNVKSLQWVRILECVKDVRDVHFSPDGRILAVAQDNNIYFWSVGDWKPVRRLKGHLSRVSTFRFSPDGLLLASASDDRTIRLWNVIDGTLVKTLKGHRSEINALAFSPDGQTLVSTSTDLTVRIWDVFEGKQKFELRGYKAYGAAYSADGSLLAIGYGDSARLYETAEYKQTGSLPSQDAVQELAFHPNGSLLASSSDVWHVGEQKLVYHLQSSGDKVAFTRTGDGLIIGKRFFQLSNGLLVHSLPTPLEETPRTQYAWESIALDPQGRLFAWGTQDGLSIWGIEGQDVVAASSSAYLAVEGDNYFNIAEKFNLGLKDLLANNGLGCDNIIYQGQPLEVQKGVVSAPFNPFRYPRFEAANIQGISQVHTLSTTCKGRSGPLVFSPDATLLASGANLWDLGRNSILVRQDNPAFMEKNADGILVPSPLMAFSPDGRLVAVRSGRDIKLWDAASGRLLSTLRGHTDEIAGLAFNSDGSLLASGSGTSEGAVRLWNTTDGSLIHTMTGFAARSLTFTPDDAILMGAWEENTIRFWRVEDGALLPSLQGIEGATALSPDGRMLAYVACSKKEGLLCIKQVINLYSLERGAITNTYVGLTEQIQDVAWSPDGRRILGASAYAILEWEIATNEVVRKLEPGPERRETIAEIFFTLDDHLLLSVDIDSRISFWDYDTGSLVHSFQHPYDYFAFAPASNLIALLAGDQVTLWGVK